jgi:hypothetical protein
MRDVMFYPYHTFVDDVLAQYKDTLPSYQPDEGSWPLSLEGVTVQKMKITSAGLPANVLSTFWSIRRFDLSSGLDFQRASTGQPLWTCAKHLNHQEFVYELNIERERSARNAKTATVRIFMGPRSDLSGRRYTLEEERHLMFMLDSFTVPLNVGMNKIYRNSFQSSLTIDFPQSLAEQEVPSDNRRPFCGCGWPRHLLLPLGTQEGLSMDVFAIVTNSMEDSVEQDDTGTEEGCRPAHIFCGLMGKKYPDARPMGYPFDRKLYLSEAAPSSVLEDLVREIPNSGHAQVSIVHRNEPRPSNFAPGFSSETYSASSSEESSLYSVE